jgi:sec-independent protein translocase protein TatA
MGNVSIWEVLLLLLVLLLVFGPKRLPEMGRALGRGLREFRDSISGKAGFDDEPDPGATAVPATVTTEPVSAPVTEATVPPETKSS